MPWQFGALGLTESGGNRVIKYADALINGVSELISLRPRYDHRSHSRRHSQASPNDGNYV